MSRIGALLLTAAVLTVATATPASAADPAESTAVPYAFSDGQTQEAVTVENGEWRHASHASGYTAAHPGWDIRLSDETYGAGLRRQDTVATATNDPARPVATTSGFISFVDDNAYGVPFLVVKLGERWTDCKFSMGADLGRIFVRKADGDLYEANINETAHVGGAAPAHTAGAAPNHNIEVTVNTLRKPSQVTGFDSFAKYQNRPSTTMNGVEIVLHVRQPDGSDGPVYRVLAGATAASC